MANPFPSVAGFEHLKGPTLLAATANGLLAFVIILATPDLADSRADLPARMFSLTSLWEATALVAYLGLSVFFILFYRRLGGAAGATNIGRTALVAAIAIVLNTILDTFFRLMRYWNWEEFLKWLFSFGVVPVLTLALFLWIVALRSPSLTSAPIRKISAVLAATMALHAILRTKSLVAELIKVGFREEWSWAGWWSFLVRPSIPVLGSAALAIFFLGVWKSDVRAIQTICSAPVSVQRWAVIRFSSLSKLSKALVIAQAAGAASVLAGSVTYVAPYNEIWSPLGRALLLPGSVVGFLILPDAFSRWYGFFDNVVQTILAVTLNTLALRLWKFMPFRRQER